MRGRSAVSGARLQGLQHVVGRVAVQVDLVAHPPEGCGDDEGLAVDCKAHMTQERLREESRCIKAHMRALRTVSGEACSTPRPGSHARSPCRIDHVQACA